MTVPKKRYWTAHFDVDPETAASSRVVAKSHSPRFQTSTKEQLLSILNDKDSKKPQASKRISDKSERTRIHVLLGFSLYSIVNILPIAGPMYNTANVVWQLVHYTVYGTPKSDNGLGFAGAQRPGGYGGVYTPPTFLGQSVIFYFTR